MSHPSEAVINRWLPQFRKGLLEFIILLRLSENQIYGYELVMEVKRLTSIELAEGTLYPLLNRLKRDGLVTSEWQIEDSGNPRKYYQITDLGIDTLEKMKGIWKQTHQSVLNMVMKS